MDWSKKAAEMKEKYVTPYIETAREIKLLNHMGIKLPNNSENNFTLREYQEDFIGETRLHKNVVVYKSRQSGYTTLYLLHMIYLLDVEYSMFGSCRSHFLLAFPNQGMCAHAKTLISEILHSSIYRGTETINYLLRDIMKHVVITTYGSLHQLCGHCFDYAYFDEFALSKDSFDFITCAVGGMNPEGRCVFVTSFSSENEEKSKRDIEQFFSKWEDVKYLETHWYEIPAFNKNLMWKKYQVEPTIDDDGNVKYNKERWDKMIADGWIPTSPAYEDMLEKLGQEKANTELLN